MASLQSSGSGAMVLWLQMSVDRRPFDQEIGRCTSEGTSGFGSAGEGGEEGRRGGREGKGGEEGRGG